MELPIELKEKIESEIDSNEIKNIIENTKNLSNKYRNESGESKVLLKSISEAKAYSLFRMPATYGATLKALEHTFKRIQNVDIKTLIDFGAGTGSATWATSEKFDLQKIVCIEREESMIELGKDLATVSEKQALKTAKWIKADIELEEIKEYADLAISSYMLNEMNKESRIKTALKMWESCKKILVIVEPGTPTRI